MIDKAVRIENQAADVRKDLEQGNARIKGEEASKQQLEATMAKTKATVMQLEGEVSTQEGVLSKAEQDRAVKDDQIRTLKDEIAHQGDMITKLGKEKRSCADGRQKTRKKRTSRLPRTSAITCPVSRGGLSRLLMKQKTLSRGKRRSRVMLKRLRGRSREN